MMNRETYVELCNQTNNMTMDTWYSKTKKIFEGQKIEDEDDFVKLVAFAYSWMPTIPEWRKELDWEKCKKALEILNIKKGEPDSLRELLQLIVPTINNSIVGASKVLHFYCPEYVPIIDSNVVISWRVLFFPTGLRKRTNGEIAELPSNFGAYGSDTDKRQKHIDLYIKYSQNLADWSKALGDVSIRDIETKLYLLGKQISDEVKAAKTAN
jgi:hypothetical protein